MPKRFDPKIRDTILDRIRDGESLHAICHDDDMPNEKTVYEWLKTDVEFSKNYAHAREIRSDRIFEEILQIADDGSNDTYEDENGREVTNHDVIARSRLRVDARKWMLGKMQPKKYGDKLDLNHSGSVTIERVSFADSDTE